MFLSDDDLEAAFADFAGARGWALAVSGGADSMALACAAARFREMKGGPDMHVLIVDHRLRAGSASEARQAADWTEALGFRTKILMRRGDPPSGDIQNAARTARYALLAEAALELSCDHIFTAHHRDDQAETFLLRLGRGSGLKGLTAMTRRAPLAPGLTLARPFLNFPKARLVATCRSAGQDWIEDPSNSDDRFARSRLRRLAPLLAAEGLTPERLSATAARLARAQAAIDSATDALLAAAFRLDEAGFGEMSLEPLTGAPEEVALRALARALASVGGGIYGPRLTRLENLYECLLKSWKAPLARTLAGCQIVAKDGRALIVREIGRIERPRIHFEPGGSAVWDGRWRITLDASSPFSLDAEPLGASGWREIAKKATRLIPAPARPALLCFRRHGDVAYAPHVGMNFPGLSVAPLSRADLPEDCLGAATKGRMEPSLGNAEPAPYLSQYERS